MNIKSVVSRFCPGKRHLNKKAFTLLELLVVILIVVILASIALPAYQRAVLKSRYRSVAPLVKAVNQGQEIYFLTEGQYADRLKDLDIDVGDVNGKTVTKANGVTVTTSGDDDEYNYVLGTHNKMDNNYIMYQKHSHNYPGEIHCEAQNNNAMAQWLCETALKATKNIGQTITEGYTTYVLVGTGHGIPPGADEDELDENGQIVPGCQNAVAMGYTCNITTNDQGKQVKKICKEYNGIGLCRIKTYNGTEGGYTSVTCVSDGSKGQDVCTSGWRVFTYDANGNAIAMRGCESVENDSTCAVYRTDYGDNWEYDEHGNLTSYRYCNSVDANDGTCKTYEYGTDHIYEYDTNGNIISRKNRNCDTSDGTCDKYLSDSYWGTDYFDVRGNITTSFSCLSGNVNSEGECVDYKGDPGWGKTEYTYDQAGNTTSEVSCFNHSGNVQELCETRNGYVRTYDGNKNLTSDRACRNVTSTGLCTEYDNEHQTFYTYSYDNNGNKISSRRRDCNSVALTGECITYSTESYDNIDYTYDSSGRVTSTRPCSEVGATGECNVYQNGSYYTYDTAGNKTSEAYCYNSTCTEGYVMEYFYDDNGKILAGATCSGNINPATKKCVAYDYINAFPENYY